MLPVPAAALAIGAAGLYGVASVVQQRAASSIAVHEAGPFRLVSRLLRDRSWLGGKAADLGAFGLQALALAHGTLILVQALLSSGLIVALALGARLAHRRLTHREWSGSLALAAGVTLLLGVGRPGGGHLEASGRSWMLAVAITAACVLLGLAIAHRSAAHRSGTLLALATGVAFALDGALLKNAAGAVRDRGTVDLTAVVSFGGFLVAAGAGNVLIQRAFQISPLVTSLPALTATEPMVGIAFGFLLYHERLRSGALPATVEVAGAILMIVGTLLVSGSAARLRVAPRSVP